MNSHLMKKKNNFTIFFFISHHNSNKAYDPIIFGNTMNHFNMDSDCYYDIIFSSKKNLKTGFSHVKLGILIKKIHSCFFP